MILNHPLLDPPTSLSASDSMTSTVRRPHSRSIYLWTGLSALLLALGAWGCEEDKTTPVDMALPDMGADMMMDMYVSTIDDRCPSARAGLQIVVLYEDRVELFKQDEVGFKVTHNCTFIAHTEQGAAEVKSMALAPDGHFYLLASEGDEGGSVYIYSNNGEFERKEGPNINLKDATRIWPLDEGFVVWIERNGSLYKLNADGSFAGTYTPPQAGSTRLTNLTDMEYIGEDREGNPWLLTLYSDRAPKLFAFPDSPEIDRVSGARAVTTLDTPVGKKLLISGKVQGETAGVALFTQVNSGRTPPTLEEVLVLEVDPGYGDGHDIVSFSDGFYILDRGGDGDRAPGLNSFNTFGVPQEQNPIGLEGAPLEIIYTNVFQDF